MTPDFKQKQQFYANGKLLLTAEYFVLRGAKAIALPVQYGQRMSVCKGAEEGVLRWKAFNPKGLWFSCVLSLPDFKVVNSNHEERALVLQEIFEAIRELNPDFQPGLSLEIETHIDFDQEWGLGSSSTLIANLARWAKVDPFKLNELVFSGSGFDIACATAEGPFFYQKNHPLQPIRLNYSFQNQLYLVYSGGKKGTRNEVRRFLNEKTVSPEQLSKINQLTDAFASAKNLEEFQQLIREHETLVGEAIGSPTVKSQYFADFEGEVKSLGAWGGDFYLVATSLDEQAVRNYFGEKGLEVIIPWREMILNKEKQA